MPMSEDPETENELSPEEAEAYWEEVARQQEKLLDEDLPVLEELAVRRGYSLRGRGSVNSWGVWLEWDDARSPVPTRVVDPAQYFARLEPFVPFTYDYAARDPGSEPSIPEPNFRRQEWDPEGYLALIRDFAGRLGGVDADGHVSPDTIGWLLSLRDALALQLRRVAERLTQTSTYYTGGTPAPLDGIRAMLRVLWVENERALLGEPSADGVYEPDPDATIDSFRGLTPARQVLTSLWEIIKGGDVPAGNLALPGVPWHRELYRLGAHPALARSANLGLYHYLLQRDAILKPVPLLRVRLLAAEAVIHRALTGQPLDEEWLESRAAAEAERERLRRKEELQRTLRDPARRRAFIEGELRDEAGRSPRSRSEWRDRWELFCARWLEAELPVDERPFPNPEAMKDAMTEARRRERMK